MLISSSFFALLVISLLSSLTIPSISSPILISFLRLRVAAWKLLQFLEVSFLALISFPVLFKTIEDLLLWKSFSSSLYSRFESVFCFPLNFRDLIYPNNLQKKDLYRRITEKKINHIPSPTLTAYTDETQRDTIGVDRSALTDQKWPSRITLINSMRNNGGHIKGFPIILRSSRRAALATSSLPLCYRRCRRWWRHINGFPN